VSPRELEESPTGARDNVARPFTDAHVDVTVAENLMRPPNIFVSHDGDAMPQHDGVDLQQQHVHPSKNIQHGLDLWERVREYDARAAAEGFMPVLKKSQKQKVKVQQILPKPPKTRARGENSKTDQ
jgi:hypothetical protein